MNDSGTMAIRPILHRVGTAVMRLAHGPWLVRAAVLLLALNLGLLSPLVCLIHCAIHATLVTPHESSVFLCSSHRVSHQNAPPANAPTPRALYEFVAAALQLVFLSIMVAGPLPHTPRRRPSSAIVTPPSPPPRLSR